MFVRCAQCGIILGHTLCLSCAPIPSAKRQDGVYLCFHCCNGHTADEESVKEKR